MEGELPQTKNKIALGIIIVVLVVAAAFVLIKFSNNKNVTPSAVPSAKPLIVMPSLQSTAEKDKLVAGFSKELILAKDAVIIKSEAYSIPNQPDQVLFSTTYTTNLPLESLHQLYINFAKDKNFKITKSSIKTDSVILIMSVSLKATTISISDLKDKRQVTITVYK